jgi:hypothetical protein
MGISIRFVKTPASKSKTAYEATFPVGIQKNGLY